VAFVDTHDTATFAGWLESADIDQRQRLGLLADKEAGASRRRRLGATRELIDRLTSAGALPTGGAHDPTAVHTAVLEELGGSQAGAVIATLEDLWAELDPQNIPGTATDHANFCRPMARTLGEIEADPALLEPLRRLDRARRQAASHTSGATQAAAGETRPHDKAEPQSGKVGA